MFNLCCHIRLFSELKNKQFPKVLQVVKMKKAENDNYFNKLKGQQLLLEKGEVNFINYIKNNFDKPLENDYQKIKYDR